MEMTNRSSIKKIKEEIAVLANKGETYSDIIKNGKNRN